MNDVTIYLKQPHPKQQLLIDSKAKRKVVRAGRRSGKTTGLALYALQKLLDGRRVLYAAPTEEQVGRFWSEVTHSLAPGIKAGLFYKNEVKHIVEPRYGTPEARIRAKSAWNAATLRGDYADLLIFDEYQMIDEEAWTRVGAPMLLDNDGDAVFAYTTALEARHARALFKRAQQAQAEAEARGIQPRWQVFTFSSHDNPYLSREALAEISKDMSYLDYRMEILAEEPDDDPRALWDRAALNRSRTNSFPELARIVVGVDPPGSATSGLCGIVVAGLAYDENNVAHGYVLEDLSIAGPPAIWAGQVVAAYNKWQADRIIAERNFGGDMVESTIRGADPRVAVKVVTASRGKVARAEPIANLYNQGRVHNVGEFPALEDEMSSWYPTGKRDHYSPNRLDACVWALSELLLDYCATEIGKVEVPLL